MAGASARKRAVMAGKTGETPRRPTQLPARHTRGFAWELDERSQAARELGADLWQLWTDLGGVESLSVQQQWLAERIVFLRRRMLAYETAVLNGSDPPMTAGEFSNFANVAVGHLKALGLQRQARLVDGLQSFLARAAKPQDGAPPAELQTDSSGDRVQSAPAPEVSA